jgi:hypothetical protein
MPDIRATFDSERYHASRIRRREAALVAEYIHELSDRHDGSGPAGEAAAERRPRADGARGEEVG